MTPKRTLHDIVASHTDKCSAKHSKAPYQLTNPEFSCGCDNLVADSPFESSLAALSFPVFHSFAPYIVKDISFSSVPVIYATLRGPPVNS